MSGLEKIPCIVGNGDCPEDCRLRSIAEKHAVKLRELPPEARRALIVVGDVTHGERTGFNAADVANTLGACALENPPAA